MNDRLIEAVNTNKSTEKSKSDGDNFRDISTKENPEIPIKSEVTFESTFQHQHLINPPSNDNDNLTASKMDLLETLIENDHQDFTQIRLAEKSNASPAITATTTTESDDQTNLAEDDQYINVKTPPTPPSVSELSAAANGSLTEETKFVDSSAGQETHRTSEIISDEDKVKPVGEDPTGQLDDGCNSNLISNLINDPMDFLENLNTLPDTHDFNMMFDTHDMNYSFNNTSNQSAAMSRLGDAAGSNQFRSYMGNTCDGSYYQQYYPTSIVDDRLQFGYLNSPAVDLPSSYNFPNMNIPQSNRKRSNTTVSSPLHSPPSAYRAISSQNEEISPQPRRGQKTSATNKKTTKTKPKPPKGRRNTKAPKGRSPLPPPEIINCHPHQHSSYNQNVVFVFSSKLANQAAEAVKQGRVSSIIEFHQSLPETERFLTCLINSNECNRPSSLMTAANSHQSLDRNSDTRSITTGKCDNQLTPITTMATSSGVGGLFKDNLTPEQLRKRQENLAKLQGIGEMLNVYPSSSLNSNNNGCSRNTESPSTRQQSLRQVVGNVVYRYPNGTLSLVNPRRTNCGPNAPPILVNGPPNTGHSLIHPMFPTNGTTEADMYPLSYGTPIMHGSGLAGHPLMGPRGTPLTSAQLEWQRLQAEFFEKRAREQQLMRLHQGHSNGLIALPHPSMVNGNSQLLRRMMLMRAGQPERFSNAVEFLRRTGCPPNAFSACEMQMCPSPKQMNYEIDGQELIITKQLNRGRNSSMSQSSGSSDLAPPLSSMLEMTNSIPQPIPGTRSTSENGLSGHMGSVNSNITTNTDNTAPATNQNHPYVTGAVHMTNQPVVLQQQQQQPPVHTDSYVSNNLNLYENKPTHHPQAQSIPMTMLVHPSRTRLMVSPHGYPSQQLSSPSSQVMLVRNPSNNKVRFPSQDEQSLGYEHHQSSAVAAMGPYGANGSGQMISTAMGPYSANGSGQMISTAIGSYGGNGGGPMISNTSPIQRSLMVAPNPDYGIRPAQVRTMTPVPCDPYGNTFTINNNNNDVLQTNPATMNVHPMVSRVGNGPMVSAVRRRIPVNGSSKVMTAGLSTRDGRERVMMQKQPYPQFVDQNGIPIPAYPEQTAMFAPAVPEGTYGSRNMGAADSSSQMMVVMNSSNRGGNNMAGPYANNASMIAYNSVYDPSGASSTIMVRMDSGGHSIQSSINPHNNMPPVNNHDQDNCPDYCSMDSVSAKLAEAGMMFNVDPFLEQSSHHPLSTHIPENSLAKPNSLIPPDLEAHSPNNGCILPSIHGGDGTFSTKWFNPPP